MKALYVCLCVAILLCCGPVKASARDLQAEAQKQMDVLWAQYYSQPQPKISWLMIMLGLLIVGLVAVFYVSCNTTGWHDVVLLESTDGRATWHPILTNRVYIAETGKAVEAFRTNINTTGREGAFYRAAIIR